MNFSLCIHFLFSDSSHKVLATVNCRSDLHVTVADMFQNFVALHIFFSPSLSGVRQALWLTKTKLISGLPPHLLSLADNPANQIPNQDERVQNAIKHARFWDTTEERPRKDKYR